MNIYVTTTLPYVNAKPHLGFALELVQADVLARHHRGRGAQVRLQCGTDDNSLKNVLAAEAAGLEVREFVDANASAFTALSGPLSISVDDVIHTSRDPRHRVGVERFWRAAAAAGDLYRKHYEGLYCVGCEQFYTAGELTEGLCPDHGIEPQRVAEQNWFFRLSRYAQQLREAIGTGAVRIDPIERRNEVLAFLDAGLADISISRSAARARGWGIPVPGDPDQVVYVWWDALGNYLTALDYGTDGPALQRWWTAADQRIHLVGKGVLRFHAVYWLAILLSAGQPLPTRILVHDYITVDGRKISKSSGVNVDPVELVDAYGTDAVRWWLLREPPRVGDADFTIARLVHRADDELANGIGNLVNRTVGAIHRYRQGRPPRTEQAAPQADALRDAIRRADDRIVSALAAYDFRAATAAVCAIADEANRYINEIRPWELAAAERAGDASAEAALDAVLGTLLDACKALGDQLRQFLPDLAGRIAASCTVHDGRLPAATPVQPRHRS
ncbi:methionine--tRNA ligase [Nocardia huaxiensis]|uniref:methionine--tRNA ligase n=1 Tax=Nocardia huaxiensis TaxID=2755382 RepID=UPI001E367620|nr:methionine--tRNA ligase [Nocardia huaxiensis]UFS98924.1 methionine--tRNA ligase [Nocardia huaxiensis]